MTTRCTNTPDPQSADTPARSVPCRPPGHNPHGCHRPSCDARATDCRSSRTHSNRCRPHQMHFAAAADHTRPPSHLKNARRAPLRPCRLPVLQMRLVHSARDSPRVAIRWCMRQAHSKPRAQVHSTVTLDSAAVPVFRLVARCSSTQQPSPVSREELVLSWSADRARSLPKRGAQVERGL